MSQALLHILENNMVLSMKRLKEAPILLLCISTHGKYTVLNGVPLKKDTSKS